MADFGIISPFFDWGDCANARLNQTRKHTDYPRGEVVSSRRRRVWVNFVGRGQNAAGRDKSEASSGSNQHHRDKRI